MVQVGVPPSIEAVQVSPILERLGSRSCITYKSSRSDLSDGAMAVRNLIRLSPVEGKIYGEGSNQSVICGIIYLPRQKFGFFEIFSGVIAFVNPAELTPCIVSDYATLVNVAQACPRFAETLVDVI